MASQNPDPRSTHSPPLPIQPKEPMTLSTKLLTIAALVAAVARAEIWGADGTPNITIGDSAMTWYDGMKGNFSLHAGDSIMFRWCALSTPCQRACAF